MAGRRRGVGDSLHEAPGRGVLACSGELCPALPRTGAPGQGPVSQGFMERTHDAYSSSGVLLPVPRPALTTQDIWAMAVLFGDVPRGLSPSVLPRHRPSHVGLRVCYGVERSRILRDTSNTLPWNGDMADGTGKGQEAAGVSSVNRRRDPRAKRRGLVVGPQARRSSPPRLAALGALT